MTSAFPGLTAQPRLTPFSPQQKQALAAMPKSPVFQGGTPIARTVSPANLKAYAGLLPANALKFSGKSVDFDVEKFLKKEADAWLVDTLEQAKEKAQGERVGLLDVTLALLEDFQLDLEEYQALENPEAFMPNSLIGRNLGMRGQKDFLNEYKNVLSRLETLKNGLEKTRQEKAVAPEARTGRFEEALTEHLSDTLLTFKSVQEQEAKLVRGKHPDLEMFLQVVMSTSSDPVVETLKRLRGMAQLRFAVPAEAYYPETVAEKTSASLESRRPVDVTERVKRVDTQPIPGMEEDVSDVLDFIQDPKSNRILMVVPNNLSKNALVEDLTKRLVDTADAKKGEVDDESFVTPNTKVFRIDYMKFRASVKEENEVFAKLLETIREISLKNDGVILHLSDFDEVLKKYGPGVNTYFDEITRDGRTKVLLTVDESFWDSEAHPAMTGGSTKSWTDGFMRKFLEPPAKESMVDFLKSHQPRLQKEFPTVTVADSAFKEAVNLGYQNMQLLPDGPLSLLRFTAQQVKKQGKGEVTAEDVRHVLRAGHFQQSLVKPQNTAHYEILTPEELSGELPPQIIGAETVLDAFGEIQNYIRQPELYKEFGAIPTRNVIIGASEGHGKTTLLKHFAVQAGVPMIYIDGKNFTGKEPNVMLNMLERAFRAAQNLSWRAEKAGKSPFVAVAVDNLHLGVAQVKGSEPIKGALSMLLAKQIKALNDDGNQHLLVLGSTGSRDGIVQDFMDKSIIQSVQEVHPMMPRQKAEMIKVLMQKKEDAHGRPLFSDTLDVQSIAVQSQENPKWLTILIDEACKAAVIRNQSAEGRVENQDFDAALAALENMKDNKALQEALPAEQIEWTAYHEAAHGVGWLFMDSLAQFGHEKMGAMKLITPIPAGQSLGRNQFLPDEDHRIGKQTKTTMFNMMVVCAISKVMEQMMYGESASGISGDQGTVRQTALTMSGKYLMLKNNKIVEPGKPSEWKWDELPEPVRKDALEAIDVAEKISRIILEQYAPFVTESSQAMLGENPNTDARTMSGEEFTQLFKEWEAANPEKREECVKKVMELKYELFPELKELHEADNNGTGRLFPVPLRLDRNTPQQPGGNA